MELSNRISYTKQQITVRIAKNINKMTKYNFFGAATNLKVPISTTQFKCEKQKKNP